VGLGLAQGDFDEEVRFCVLLAHFWGVYNISYLGWVKIIIIIDRFIFHQMISCDIPEDSHFV
jgi:hypothetical protein